MTIALQALLVGGNGQTTLEGLTECVNERWMQSLHRYLHSIKWIVFHCYVDYFQRKLSLGRRPNANPGDHGNMKSQYVLYFIMCEDPA